MGNEVSTLGGAVAIAATSIAAGITFGQVDPLNNAVEESFKFALDAASKTVIRHIGETIGTAIGTSVVAVAAGVTLGQVDVLNKTVIILGRHSVGAVVASRLAVAQIGNDLVNGIPIVGHIKGGVHYTLGDKEGGDRAIKLAMGTTGVITGGALCTRGGLVGILAGGIAGGAIIKRIGSGVEGDTGTKGEEQAPDKGGDDSGSLNNKNEPESINGEGSSQQIGGVTNQTSPLAGGENRYGSRGKGDSSGLRFGRRAKPPFSPSACCIRRLARQIWHAVFYKKMN